MKTGTKRWAAVLAAAAALFAAAAWGLCAARPAAAEEAPERLSISLNSCDEGADWLWGVTTDYDYVEGDGAVVSTGVGPIFGLQISDFELIARQIYRDEAYVEFFLYVDYPEFIDRDCQLEFTSCGGVDDANEISWNLTGLFPNLEPGWNYVALSFAEAGFTGAPDYDHIDFMRMYFGASENAVILIDDLRITDSPRAIAASDIVSLKYRPAPKSYVVDPAAAGFAEAEYRTPLLIVSCLAGVLLAGGAAALIIGIVKYRKSGGKAHENK